MNDFVKYALIGGAVLVGYNYLKAGALGSTFSDTNALLAYCRANPNGSATYQANAKSQGVTATCAQWIQANSSRPSIAPGSPKPAGVSSIPDVWQTRTVSRWIQ